MADTFIFRIDHHGSLVRPPETRGLGPDTPADERRRVEASAIGELARAQRDRSLSIVTDGFVGRSDRFQPVSDAVKGLEPRDTHRGQRWIAVTGELSADGPIVDTNDLISAVTEHTIKVSLPSPSAMAGHFWDDEASPAGWESPRQLGEALAGVMRVEIERLFAAGVGLIQLDNHRLAGWLTPGAARGKLSLEDSIAVDALAIADIQKPEHASIGICPILEVAGDVDVAAAEQLFASVPANRWVLPLLYGSDAELALIGAVPPDRDLCLGVVDAAKSELEDLDLVLDRLDRVVQIRDGDEDTIALSPNQGFADVADSPLLGADDQWKKLTHVETLARMYWGNEL
jgi:5-methyltetrahydropteroyltriglutamate--homocysteine methyltransferase